MAAEKHRTNLYVGLAAEGEYTGPGGLFRRADGEDGWTDISKGLPETPQVRALAVHPETPNVVYAGTQDGVYRSDDRGGHWEAMGMDKPGVGVWSLAFHPKDPNIVFAGYEPCEIHRTLDGGSSWKKMNTSEVQFPHITTYMPPTEKRVLEIAIDPSDPLDMYAAIEVGGLLGSRDGGESWKCLTDGPYVWNNSLDLHGVQVSTAAPGTVFIVAQIGMFVSRDRGERWEHVQIPEQFKGGSYCRDIMVSPDDPRTMYLAASAGGGGAPAGTKDAGGLFRTRDLWETWEQLDLGEVPDSRTFEVSIDRAAPSHVYCGALMGPVYSSYDGGESWTNSQVPVEKMSRNHHIYAMACG